MTHKILIQSDKISFIQRKPYYIFKIDNFLDEDLYDSIDRNFPSFEEIKMRNSNVSKLYTGISKKSYDKEKFKILLDNHKCLKDFDTLIESSLFFNFFKKNFYLHCALTQNNLLKTLKYLRPIKKNEGKKYFYDNLTSKISVNYSYTTLPNNGYMRPHVDALRKYMSLLLYFPSNNHDDKEYGTSFWISKDKNYSNTHLLEDKQYNKFKKINKLIFKPPFKKNTLYGFIRNDLSWHSVEPLNISEEYIRRTITINFVYDN